jgi:hypothetical protein
MKTLISFLITCVGLALPSASSGADDPFVVTVNQAWKNKNHAAVASAVEATLQQRPNDILVLYTAYNFYLMVQPDLPKLVDAANQIKALADGTNKPAIKAFSDRIQSNLPKIQQEGLKQPTSEMLESLHKEFDDEFPLISLGSRLRRELQK